MMEAMGLRNQIRLSSSGAYKTGTRFSIRFLTGILIITAALLVAIGTYDYHAQQAVDQLKGRCLQIEQLRGRIIHDDEVMTMAARMAAATGDIVWEKHYLFYKPKLESALREAMKAFPEIYRDSRRAAIGKFQLMQMEEAAFDLVRRGQNQEAVAILFGPGYEAQRSRYERSVDELNGLLQKQMDAALSVESSKEHLCEVAFITVFILLLLSWLVLLFIARGAQEALVQSLRWLDELNKSLDEKVHERTRRLARTLRELQKAHRDLQKVQAQLLQAEKFSAIGHLAGGIAHEINNPIGFINSNLQTLQKYAQHYSQLLGFLNKLEKALNERDTELMGKIINSWEKVRRETNFHFIEGDIGNLITESLEGCEHIRKIVADLSTLVGPDGGGQNAVDLQALMDSMVNVAWNEIKYKAQLRKEYDSLPPVVCNPQKIGQVFINLLTNAAQAIKDKGLITVKTYRKDRYACVDVCDTGCGISPENLTRIFDPFFTTRPAGHGVGLGLSTSYDIIRRHGGNLVFSSNLGQGTTFTVMLPAESLSEAALHGEGI